ncbi:hypothetical protein [Elioraea sp.]
MLRPKRAIARLRRMGVSRVMAIVVALLLWFAFRGGGRDPSLINIRRF